MHRQIKNNKDMDIETIYKRFLTNDYKFRNEVLEYFHKLTKDADFDLHKHEVYHLFNGSRPNFMPKTINNKDGVISFTDDNGSTALFAEIDTNELVYLANKILNNIEK